MPFRNPQLTVCLVSFIFVALAAGCSGNAESELMARLDLAQATGDLDEMFVALTQMSDPDDSDSSYKLMLSDVETAIDGFGAKGERAVGPALFHLDLFQRSRWSHLGDRHRRAGLYARRVCGELGQGTALAAARDGDQQP